MGSVQMVALEIMTIVEYNVEWVTIIVFMSDTSVSDFFCKNNQF